MTGCCDQLRFFDEQDLQANSASEWVPTAEVLYCSNSQLRALQAERDGKNRGGDSSR